MSSPLGPVVVALAAGFVGGLAGAALWQRSSAPAPARAPLAAGPTASLLRAERIELVDAKGQRRAELALSIDGGPALFFFDSAGRNRLELGLYSAAEGEAPTVVLNDPDQRAAGIFRLYGPKDAPVLVLKHEGRDRSVYGLDAGSFEPFLSNYAADGHPSHVFGRP